MIESVRIYKNSRTVDIRYMCGKHVTVWELPKTALKFILRIEVKAFENDDSILYRL